MSTSQAFKGYRVLVTGGASGIGKATCVMLAERGAELAIADIDAQGLQAVSASLRATPLHVDLGNSQATTEAVESAAKALNGLDGIVNCAGAPVGKRLADLELADWARALDVNLTAPYLICRAALPFLLRSEHASIVNISSGVALVPVKGGGDTAYSATKAGLLGMTRSLAAELAPHIRVNAVCPGATDTPLLRRSSAGRTGDWKQATSAYALGRLGTPEEIAAAVAFLLSDEASFITGVTLSVDGGRTFH